MYGYFLNLSWIWNIGKEMRTDIFNLKFYSVALQAMWQLCGQGGSKRPVEDRQLSNHPIQPLKNWEAEWITMDM